MSAIGRVTGQQLYSSSQTSINAARLRLSALQEQASSGLVINRPSDDPTGTATVLRLRGELAANTQYGTNMADGLSWLRTADSAFSTSTDLVRKASDLTVQAANAGTSSPAAREAIATQLVSIKQDLLAQANTTYLGRSVFAGTSDAATAFNADGTVNSTVTAGSGLVQRRISATETVAVSADGAAAFGTVVKDPATGAVTSDTSVFSSLDKVIAALRSPDWGTDLSATGPQAAITGGIIAMQTARNALTTQQAVVGTAYARIEAAQSRNSDAAVQLEKQRSGIQDADTASVLLNLKTQELAYQTSLQVTAQVLQPTLMNFLK